jgi:hypothetical protein
VTGPVRLPFVAACAIADRLGRSESVVIDEASDAPFTLPREWYLRFPEAVAGYDLAVRPLPRGGLDPTWLGPVASAVRAEPTVVSACAWSVAPGLPDPVEVLGLFVDPALGPGGFHRARASVRERAGRTAIDGVTNRLISLLPSPADGTIRRSRKRPTSRASERYSSMTTRQPPVLPGIGTVPRL